MLSLHFPSALTSSPSGEQLFFYQEQHTLFSKYIYDYIVEGVVLPAEGSFLVLGYLDQLGEFRGTYTNSTNP
jgi:hypothetical protein